MSDPPGEPWVIRREYITPALDERVAGPDPVAAVRRWLEEAVAADLPEPGAMTLGTVDPDGRPSARVVLLRGLDERGFVFFTSYESDKAAALAVHPDVALVLSWLPLHRQVRVTGPARRLPPEDSDLYFATRPRGSQLGAWASRQSRVLSSRAELDERFAALEAQYPDGTEIPRPPYWGGYAVIPERIELWQGRTDRLHDRLRYSRTASGWAVERLAP